MLDTLNNHYQLFVLLLLTLLLMVGAYCALCLLMLQDSIRILSNQLSSVDRVTQVVGESLSIIQEQVDQLSGAHSDLHALTAHFVAHRRTKNDISQAYHFERDAQYGVDLESQFRNNPDK